MHKCELCGKPALPQLSICEFCRTRENNAKAEKGKQKRDKKPENIVKLFPDKEKKELERVAVELGIGMPKPQNIASAMKIANELGLKGKSTIHFAFEEDPDKKNIVIVTLEDVVVETTPSFASSDSAPVHESDSEPDPESPSDAS